MDSFASLLLVADFSLSWLFSDGTTKGLYLYHYRGMYVILQYAAHPLSANRTSILTSLPTSMKIENRKIISSPRWISSNYSTDTIGRLRGYGMASTHSAGRARKRSLAKNLIIMRKSSYHSRWF